MKHADFKIGDEFLVGDDTDRWLVTDVGSRTVIAIRLDENEPRNNNGPPYSVMEYVFDEYDFSVCNLVEK